MAFVGIVEVLACGKAETEYWPSLDATSEADISPAPMCDAAVFDQTTADGGPCELHKTGDFKTGCGVIEKSSHCDRLFFKTSADAGANVSAMAPGFDCRPDSRGDLECIWNPGDAGTGGYDLFDQICAVTRGDIPLVADNGKIICAHID